MRSSVSNSVIASTMSKRKALKSRLQKLSKQRDEYEKEIAEIVEDLNSPGPKGAPPVGLKGNLLTHDGFPRNDIDIHAIRIQRNRLAHLQTDHKEIMKQIEQTVKDIFALPKDEAEGGQAKEEELGLAEEDELEAEHLVAFLVVQDVSEGSPAEEAGLRNGDKILKFGRVKQGGKAQAPEFSAIVQEVTVNANKPIIVIIERNLARKKLVLTPKSWAGRGMLGCQLVRV